MSHEAQTEARGLVNGFLDLRGSAVPKAVEISSVGVDDQHDQWWIDMYNSF